MQLGMIGLGRMGANMVRRLARGGHECVVYDVQPDAVKRLVQDRVLSAMRKQFGGHEEKKTGGS